MKLLQKKCNVSDKYISALETSLSSGSIPLIIDICNNILDSQALIYYEKLKTENKEFVIDTIIHLYNMQKKR